MIHVNAVFQWRGVCREGGSDGHGDIAHTTHTAPQLPRAEHTLLHSENKQISSNVNYDSAWLCEIIDVFNGVECVTFGR